jgi:hypothetical protein
MKGIKITILIIAVNIALSTFSSIRELVYVGYRIGRERMKHIYETIMSIFINI